MKELIRDYIVDNFGLHNTHFFKTPLMDIFIIPKGVDCAFIYMALVYMKKRRCKGELLIQLKQNTFVFLV